MNNLFWEQGTGGNNLPENAGHLTLPGVMLPATPQTLIFPVFSEEELLNLGTDPAEKETVRPAGNAQTQTSSD